MTLEHFGDKARVVRQTILESTFRVKYRSTKISCRRSTAKRARPNLVLADLKLKFHITTKLSLAKFNLIFMYSAIVLCNTCFLIFYYSQHKVFRVFNSLERRSKTHLDLCIGTPVFLPYSIYAFYSDICYVLFGYV